MNRPVRMLVFHRNRLFCECLAQVLVSDGYEVSAIDPAAPVDDSVLSPAKIDMILVDLNLADNTAVKLIQQARKIEKRVVVLVPDDHEKLVECIAAGAHGCVLERSSLSELRPAIEKVMRGETFCSADIVQSMFSQLSKLAREAQWRTQVHSAKLTGRELEVLELLGERLSNKQIAKRLSVSLYTVKNHVHNILEKLQVETRLDAVENARQRRWLDSP